MARTKERQLVEFHGRLFEDQVEELKRRAGPTGAAWQGYLRGLIDRALESERKEKVIS